MSLIKCPECGKEISSMAESCPHCGYPIRKSQNSENNSAANPFSNNKSYQDNPFDKPKQTQRRSSGTCSIPSSSLPQWTKKWTSKRKIIRTIWFFADLITVFFFFFTYLSTRIFAFFIITIVFVILFAIPAGLARSIRTEVQKSDDHVIVVHSSFYKYLVVDEEILSKTTSKTLEGYLPDGRKVIAVIPSSRKQPIKIEVKNTEDEIDDFE